MEGEGEEEANQAGELSGRCGRRRRPFRTSASSGGAAPLGPGERRGGGRGAERSGLGRAAVCWDWDWDWEAVRRTSDVRCETSRVQACS